MVSYSIMQCYAQAHFLLCLSLSDFPPWRAHAQAREYDHARRVGVAAALIAWATMLASLTTVLAWTSSRLSPNTAYIASLYSSMALAGILACMGLGACIYALFYLDAQGVSQLVGFCISYILRTWMDVHTHTHTHTHTHRRAFGGSGGDNRVSVAATSPAYGNRGAARVRHFQLAHRAAVNLGRLPQTWPAGGT